MNKTNIRAIIFDFGGVLLEWDPHNLYKRYFNNPKEIDDFLTEINFSEWNMQQDKGRSFSEGVADLSEKYPHYRDLIHAYKEYWEESIVGPIEGSVAILHELKKDGYSLYGLSNWSAETFPKAFNKYDFFKVFDGIIISGDVKVVKPDPAIFEILLKMVGLPASDCLLIDDSSANIISAHKLGFASILYRSPSQLKHELVQYTETFSRGG
jgi:2-haloacid dehalogenase